MRARKAGNTVIRQYKYSVSTDLRPLPPEVWEVARRMQAAWNALIPAYAESELMNLNRLYDSAWQSLRESKDEAAYKTAKRTLDERKRETWLVWEKQAKELITPFGLDYSQGPNVIERFNGCIKAGRTCFPETELTHIQIPFIFPGSAAIPAAALYNNPRRWRIVVEGYSHGMFNDNRQASRRERRMVYMELGLTKDIAMPLRIDWHRPLPQEGMIKRVLLCGKKMPFRGWRWHALFQVERPIAQTVPRTEAAVDVRICWTRFEDSIIVAQWKDSAGGEGALTWPLTPTNQADRETSARRPEWRDWILSYSDLGAYKTEEFALPQGSEARMKMRERRRRVEERWQARRRWLYRNFAAWLVREYTQIRLPDLDVKRIAEDDLKTGALKWADRNRQIAAPGDLLSILKETAEKHGRVTEKYSQTEVAFSSISGLRQSCDAGKAQLFDVAWNSRVVAGGVHSR